MPRDRNTQTLQYRGSWASRYRDADTRSYAKTQGHVKIQEHADSGMHKDSGTYKESGTHKNSAMHRNRDAQTLEHRGLLGAQTLRHRMGI